MCRIGLRPLPPVDGRVVIRGIADRNHLRHPYQEAVFIMCELGQATAGGYDAWQLACHGFQDRQSPTLSPGWQDEGMATLHQGDEPGEADRLRAGDPG